MRTRGDVNGIVLNGAIPTNGSIYIKRAALIVGKRFEWHVRVTLETSKRFAWDVRNTVGASVLINWDVYRIIAERPLRLRWNIGAIDRDHASITSVPDQVTLTKWKFCNDLSK